MPYKPPGMVERLRECPSPRELKHGIDAETTAIWHRLCCDAADEIDRLTAENKRLRAALDEIANHRSIAAEAREKIHRQQVELDAWRTRRFFWTKDLKRVGINRPNPDGPGFIGHFQSEHDTIDEAVDALMEEEE